MSKTLTVEFAVEEAGLLMAALINVVHDIASIAIRADTTEDLASALAQIRTAAVLGERIHARAVNEPPAPKRKRGRPRKPASGPVPVATPEPVIQ